MRKVLVLFLVFVLALPAVGSPKSKGKSFSKKDVECLKEVYYVLAQEKRHRVSFVDVDIALFISLLARGVPPCEVKHLMEEIWKVWR